MKNFFSRKELAIACMAFLSTIGLDVEYLYDTLDR